MYEYIVRFIGERTESIEEIQKDFGCMENAAKIFIPGIKAMLYQTILHIDDTKKVISNLRKENTKGENK